MNKRHEMPPIGCQFVDRFGVNQHGTLQGIGGFCHPASVLSKAQIKSNGYDYFCVGGQFRTILTTTIFIKDIEVNQKTNK